MQKWISALTTLMLAVGLAALVVAQETSDEEAAVKMIASQWADAWNAGDMEAIGALYAEGSDYVSFFGKTTQGPEQIKAAFGEVHSTVYKGSKIAIETTAVRLVKPDVAVYDGTWELTGLPEGAEAPSKGLSTTVLVKQDGEWKIAAHRTQVPSPPAE